MRRIGSMIFIVLFFVVCLVPGIWQDQSGWISLRNRVLRNVFQTSGTDQVVVGEEGWLYYGETSGHFTGENRLTEEELTGVLDYLEALSEYFEKQGIRFIFVCAPNKNTIYPEYMPGNFLQAPGSDAARVAAGLEARQVVSPDLVSVFGKIEDQLYHKLDSHWNNRGAAIAAEYVLSFAGKTVSYSHLPCEERCDYSGDLAEMLYPDGLTTKDCQVYYKHDFAYRYLSVTRTMMEMEITTKREDQTGRLFMVRDSFGISFIPFVADAFGECRFTRQGMTKVLTETQGYDVVVLEIAERNLRNLLKEELP